MHPLAFWPDHRGEKSPEPRLSALARKGAMAAVAKGKAGAAGLIGPSSFIIRFTIPRAGRPVKRFVSAVCRAASLFSAVAFEVAKRLFGLYMTNVASFERAAVDVNLGALILFILWMYYSALVFLLGGVVAETWELRELQRRQRARVGEGRWSGAVGRES